jgi:excisionase family DNA binding protein
MSPLREKHLSAELPTRAPLLTASEVAEILNISVRSVRRMIDDGRLSVVRIGRAVRVRPEAIAALIEGK